MKHLSYVSKQSPAHANVVDSLKDHPDLLASLAGLLTPLQTIRLHLNK